MQQWAPRHFKLQGRDSKWHFANDYPGIVAFEPAGSCGQGDDQVVLLREGHRCLIVPRKNADASLFTELGECGVDPTQSLHIAGVNAHPDTHSAFTDPDVAGAQIGLQLEVSKNGVIRA